MTEANRAAAQDAPTEEEIAAAYVAVHALRRRRAERGREPVSRWLRAARTEAVTALAEQAAWAAERP